MNLSERILASILATLVAWLVTRIVTYYIQRSRIKAAMITDLELHQRGIRTQDQAISAMFENGVLEVGQTIPFPIRYVREEWLLYRSLQKDLPFYLSSGTLRKVIKFYHLMWELDHSMYGFATVLEEWGKSDRVLTQADIEHLERRFRRMKSMVDLIIQDRITRLRDLPDDYQGAITMQTVFQLKRNHEPSTSPESADDQNSNSKRRKDK